MKSYYHHANLKGTNQTKILKMRGRRRGRPAITWILANISLLFLWLAIGRVGVGPGLLPFERLQAVEPPWWHGQLQKKSLNKHSFSASLKDIYQGSEGEAGSQDVNRLRELLNDVSPDEADGSE